jgi:predicted phosphoribosyltransferase
MKTDKFKDRAEAGRLLSRRFESWTKDGEDVLVLGLPRGGVPVASRQALETLRREADVASACARPSLSPPSGIGMRISARFRRKR